MGSVSFWPVPLQPSKVAVDACTVAKNQYQIAHDRATFLPMSKIQKLLENGGQTCILIPLMANHVQLNLI